MCDDIEKLKAIIAEREKEIEILKSKLDEIVSIGKKALTKSRERLVEPYFVKDTPKHQSILTPYEIKRYSRQLIMPEISVDGQISLKNSKILIVGAGGLGCPVGMYLAAAGVGTIGIVDYDTIDVSNLHRQISHFENRIGSDKCFSLKRTLQNLNSTVNINIHSLLLNSENVEEIFKLYDIIVDASDNLPTRYLLNDAAVLFKKILVSGSALKFEGQLTVYNYLDGPCYRCLFPNPPPPETVTNCSDGGVIGAVTGVIGSFQALEVIKIIVGLGPSYYKKMLMFDGLTGDVRIFKLRSKKTDCEICGENPTINKLIDYEMYCSTKANDKESVTSLLSDSQRISCTEYKSILDSGVPHVLIDVRPENEMKICSLSNAVNIPINKITNDTLANSARDIIKRTNESKHYVICRRGNDSQKAVKILQSYFPEYIWYDIIGGLYSWHNEIDDTLPLY